MQRNTDFPIAIIGAGFAGIGAAVQLKKAGIESFTIFERSSEVGGTWRDNTYPGAACDVPSHVYSLSFEQNPNWSRRYATSSEIQEYLVGVVDKHELHERMRLETEIVEARFDEDSGTWSLTANDGESFTARAVIAGVGGLVDPSYPKIAGMDQFDGELMHTARWNHDVDLTDKRVAVDWNRGQCSSSRAEHCTHRRNAERLSAHSRLGGREVRRRSIRIGFEDSSHASRSFYTPAVW